MTKPKSAEPVLDNGYVIALRKQVEGLRTELDAAREWIKESIRDIRSASASLEMAASRERERADRDRRMAVATLEQIRMAIGVGMALTSKALGDPQPTHEDIEREGVERALGVVQKAAAMRPSGKGRPMEGINGRCS